MNKNRKTSHILNVFQFDANGHVILPATLTIGENPHSSDNTSKIPSTAWIRTYVTGLSYLTGNQSITVSGDATGSGTTAITLTLANTAVTPGTYGSTTLVPVVTVDSKGRITSVTTAAISGSLTFTGDVTGSGTTGTSTAMTVAASGVTAGTYTKVTVDSKGRVTVGANASTTDISEGTNLYYTDTRVGTYLTANSYATQSYVGTQVANLVAAAPATLDTLNELAAALGNDPSFATTVSTSIGTKVPQTRTLTINGTAYDLSADRAWTIVSMIYPSAGIAISTGTGWGTSITDNSANWNTAYGWGNHASGGYLTSATAATTYASLTGTYANPAFISSLAYSKITGVPAFLTSYTETDPYRVTSVAVSGTSTKTITLTRADASTVTTTWTDIDTDTNTYVTSAGFSGGTLTLTRNDAGTVTVSLDGRYYLASNPSSYITSSSLSGYVPYTGATANIDTGGYSITAGAVTLTSNLWLKNIGTYDFIMSNGTSLTTNTIRAYYNTSDELRFYAKNTAGGSVVPKIMVGDGTTFYTIYHTGNLPTIPTNNNQLTNGAGYITSITSGNVTTALGFTPYNATNPAGYITGVTNISGYAGYLPTAYAGGVQANPQTYFNNGIGVKVAMTGSWSTWSDTLWINGYSGGDVKQMCALHTLRNGTPRMAISVQAHDATTYGTYYEFITAYNIASQTVASAGNATTAGGLAVHTDRNNEANKIVRTDVNGYIQAGWINTLSGDNGTSAITRIYASDDGYIRYYTPANFRQVLDVPTRTGGSASGTWGISISGNAATATTAPSGTNRGDQIHGSAGVTPATSFGSMPSAMSGFTDNWGGGDLPSGMSHVHGIACRHFNNASNNWGWHMVGQYDQPGDLRVRWVNAGTWTGYYQLVTTSNIGSQKADGSLKLWAASHPNDYYIVNNWTGTHWQLTSNHGSGVRVAYADTAGSATSATSATSASYADSIYWSGNQRLYGGSDGTRNTGWAYHNDNGTGLHWPNNGWHIYPINASDMYIRSGASDCSLKFTKSGTSGSYIHCAADNAIGFLTTGRSWSLRVDDSGGGTFYGGLTVKGPIYVDANEDLYLNYNYGCSVVGVYASTRFQGVYSMGNAYKLSRDGTTPGNLYGLSWSHPNAGGQAGYLDNHGLLVMLNGTTYSAISNSIWARGDVTAFSDSRVKTNIEVVENAIEKIKAIRGVTFNRTDMEHDTKRHAGVIAQEVLAVLPEVVTTTRDGMHSVAYGNLAALFIEAIKEQQKEIDELKSLINGLTK